MAEMSGNTEAVSPAAPVTLEKGTYEIIRNRLAQQGKLLQDRLVQLNDARRTAFGALSLQVLATERISTEHNCVPVDMALVGGLFLFGYNVRLGLKTEMAVTDVFSTYRYAERRFEPLPAGMLSDARFEEDFRNLYKYYRNTRFSKFARIGQYLFMVFQTGKSPTDIKTFKWAMQDDSLVYVDNRSDHEVGFPPQHEFTWKRAGRDHIRNGKHPHLSIEDKIFVETIGGDLTIKVEDNTDSGQGIYHEEVENKDQTLDDAEVHYAMLNNLILLKIRPYKETRYRYILYSEKLREARRVDSIEDACALLPDDQGIIFSDGFCLQNGTFKRFELPQERLKFEKKIISPNGEDFLYIFFNQAELSYRMFFYSMIEQKLDAPLLCHGYTIFQNGELLFLKAESEPQRHHTIYIWQTPFTSPNFTLAATEDSFLQKIGNKEVVRAMADCREIITLLGQDDSYLGLYVDISRKAGNILDNYTWLDRNEAFALREPVEKIKESAASAIDEYEKVSQIRKNTRQQTEKVQEGLRALVQKIKRTPADSIQVYVDFLSALRNSRGEVLSLRELRYADLEQVKSGEQEVEKYLLDISTGCVNFLLGDEALLPYSNRVNDLMAQIEKVSKSAAAKALEEEMQKAGTELDMLIEIVGNLKIDDPTHTTRIIEDISGIYSRLNQARSGLRNRRQELTGAESKAEFAVQLKLIDQSCTNFLDLCDRPEKCDQFLNKLLIQLEELEGRFAELEEFGPALAEKREEIINAFEGRKLALVEKMNKAATAMMQSAERILKGIRNKAGALKSVQEINGYFASDLMVDKVRDLSRKLRDLGDAMKAEDLEGRLKTAKEECVRQLRDRQELFTGDEADLIKFGTHRFAVNRLELDLTTVLREGEMYYHLTGTRFFDRIEDETLNTARKYWEQSLPSENTKVYRAEYLAYRIFREAERKKESESGSLAGLERLDLVALEAWVQSYMAPLYEEGYQKGIHDHDAALILQAVMNVNRHAGLLRYAPVARACAAMFWTRGLEADEKKLLDHRLKGAGTLLQIFPNTQEFDGLIAELKDKLEAFCNNNNVFAPESATEAAAYLFYEIGIADDFLVDTQAARLYGEFTGYLTERSQLQRFQGYLNALQADWPAAYALATQWLSAWLSHSGYDEFRSFIPEVAYLLLSQSVRTEKVRSAALTVKLDGMRGQHACINAGQYQFDYHQFSARLQRFTAQDLPGYTAFVQHKRRLADGFRKKLRLEEFQPKVLTSFVRNKLIDQVYLPFIGANLAKQIGAAGDDKRTDNMGMLLLISPPGYGKTTLMEYVASRLGIVFMKINGPAIGHRVTSLDPAEAPNAGARQELEKLNLAFEMGDNVMIYVDDIQHCSPEFLQKFISLCDAQRKIEGVYKGQSKTYDFRGRKVAVVMAGNPYTESGDVFKIPDMLANRADIYNLGDILGGSEESFKMSYLENSLTSNPVLRKLAARSEKDIHPLVRLAETGTMEGLNLEGNHTPEEISEYVHVLQKLFKVRDVVLTVNKEYIRSAAQAEDYRTEPAFKLQGSYRNMNKMAEKVLPVLNDEELHRLIHDHYLGEAQTLTTGAEANLLKLKELLGEQTSEEQSRWTMIRDTFVRNRKIKSLGGDGQTAHALEHLEAIAEGLKGIKDVIDKA